MGYTLLWLETLGAALLFLATVAALFARVRWWRLPRFVPILTALAMFGVTAVGTYVVAVTQFGSMKFHTTWFAPVLCWSVVFALGASALLLRGLRRGAERTTVARTWPLRNLALGFAAALVLSCITFANMDTAVKLQLAAVRAEAGSRILALAPRRLPDSLNAAPLYLDAFELLPPLGRPAPVWLNSKGEIDYDAATVDPRSKAFRAFIQAQQPALELFRKGAALPGFWFERDYFDGMVRGLRPEEEQLKHAAVLLAYDALALAAEGKSRQALSDVAAIFGIARQFKQPMLLPLLVSVDIERTGFFALQDVLRLAPPTSSDLQAISLPARDGYRTELEPALRMDEAAGLTCFGMLSVQPLPEPIYYLEGGRRREPELGWILGSPVYRVFLLAGDLASYRRNMYEVEELCKQPYFEAISKIRAADENWSATRDEGFVARMLTAGPHISAILAEGEAYHRLSRLGLAGRAYELKYGSAPSSIDSLTPEFQPRTPLDPFDGKPMRMKAGKGEVLFYSVGYRRKDDGVVPEDPERATPGSDLVFRLKGK